jgi:hypothetical protein
MDGQLVTIQGHFHIGMLGYYQTSHTRPKIKYVGDAAEAAFGYVLEQRLDWWHTPLETLRVVGQLCGDGGGCKNPEPPKPTGAGLIKTLTAMFAMESRTGL